MIDAVAQATLRRAAAHVVVGDVDNPVIDEAADHHIFRVLRVRDGESVTVTDGRGRWRACRAAGTSIEPIAAASDVAERQSTYAIAFAIPKGDRPEWVVQKLTEIGIGRIVLLHADRSVVHWDAPRADRHLARLQRVAVEALQQSRGVWLPEIVGPVPAHDLLASMPVAEPGGRALAPGDRSVAIGPEGGWSQAELESAPDQVSLGRSVLRIETAAVVAAARLIDPLDGTVT